MANAFGSYPPRPGQGGRGGGFNIPTGPPRLYQPPRPVFGDPETGSYGGHFGIGTPPPPPSPQVPQAPPAPNTAALPFQGPPEPIEMSSMEEVTGKIKGEMEKRAVTKGIEPPAQGQQGAFAQGQGPGQQAALSMMKKSLDSVLDLAANSEKFFADIDVDESKVDKALEEMQMDAESRKGMSRREKNDFLLNMGLNMMMRGGQPGAEGAGLAGIMGASALSAMDMFRKQRFQLDAKKQRMQELGLARLGEKENRVFKQKLAAQEAKLEAVLETKKLGIDIQKAMLDYSEALRGDEAYLAGVQAKTKSNIDVANIRAKGTVEAAKVRGKTAQGAKTPSYSFEDDEEHVNSLFENIQTEIEEGADAPEDDAERAVFLKNQFTKHWIRNAEVNGTGSRATILSQALKSAKTPDDLAAMQEKIASDPAYRGEYDTFPDAEKRALQAYINFLMQRMTNQGNSP